MAFTCSLALSSALYGYDIDITCSEYSMDGFGGHSVWGFSLDSLFCVLDIFGL
jgi:hypothetical protein